MLQLSFTIENTTVPVGNLYATFPCANSTIGTTLPASSDFSSALHLASTASLEGHGSLGAWPHALINTRLTTSNNVFMVIG